MVEATDYGLSHSLWMKPRTMDEATDWIKQRTMDEATDYGLSNRLWMKPQTMD